MPPTLSRFLIGNKPPLSTPSLLTYLLEIKASEALALTTLLVDKA